MFFIRLRSRRSFLSALITSEEVDKAADIVEAHDYVETFIVTSRRSIRYYS
jgi:hypothetical protein